MKLFSSNTSPYARKVRVVIAEKTLGSLVEEVVVDVYSDPPELLAANPLGKVPTLVTDEGEGMFDSPVICAYLDAHPQGQGPRLKPHSGPEHWAVLRAEAFSDGITDLAFGLNHEKRKPEGEKSPTTAKRWRGQLIRSLDAATAMLHSLPQGVTLGHLSLACALGYLDLRHDDLGWRNGRDELARWFETMSQRPSIAATVPPK
jgi:glutathione S-transferase